MKASEVKAAYTELWSAFSSAAQAQQLLAHMDPPGGDITNATVKSGVIAKSLLYLPGWPRKRTSDKPIDVVVQVLETFSQIQQTIVKSTVQVGYFREAAGGKKRAPILQMHYDYEEDVDTAHPVFHAQFGDTTWPLRKLEQYGFDQANSTHVDVLSTARIPTAFMGFGQVLLMLAADHLKTPHYTTFLQSLRKNASATWEAACPSLKTSLATGGYLHSHHWYIEPAAARPAVAKPQRAQSTNAR